MKQANNGMNLVISIRCYLKSLNESQLLLGKCSILHRQSGNRSIETFGIVSNSAGVDVYLDKKNIPCLGLLTVNAVCEILLLRWAKKQLRSRLDTDILMRNLVSFWDSSNAQGFLNKERILLEEIELENQSQQSDCPCKGTSQKVYKWKKTAGALSRTAGKHQGLSRRRLEEFYHG